MSVYGGEEEKKQEVRAVVIAKETDGEEQKGDEKKLIKEDLEVIFRRQSPSPSVKKSPKKSSKPSPSPSPSPSSSPSPLPSPSPWGGGDGGDIGGVGWGFGGSRGGSVIGTGFAFDEKKGKKKREKEKDKKKKKGKGGGVGGGVGGGLSGGLSGGIGGEGEVLRKMGDNEGRHREAMRQICGEICELTLSSSSSIPTIPPLSPSPSSPEQDNLPKNISYPSSCPPPSFFSSPIPSSASSFTPTLPIQVEENDEPLISPRKSKSGRKDGCISPPVSPRGWKEEKKKKDRKRGWRNTLALRSGARPLDNCKDIIDIHEMATPSRDVDHHGEENVNENQEESEKKVNGEENDGNNVNNENIGPETERDDSIFHFEDETEERDEGEKEEEGEGEEEEGEGGEGGEGEDGEGDEVFFFPHRI